MEKANKVSIWIGYFESEQDFEDYIEGYYNENGDYILSKFERDFKIEYNLDYIEKKFNFNGDLKNFSNDIEIKLKFQKKLQKLDLIKYNSIVILYNFEYIGNIANKKLIYIGTEEINCCVDKELLKKEADKNLGQILSNDEKRIILNRFYKKLKNNKLNELNLENINIKDNIFLYLCIEDKLYLTQKNKILDFIINNQCIIFDFYISGYKHFKYNL